MRATCPDCGRPLSDHDRHVRFTLPDPVIDAGSRIGSDAFWMSHDTPRDSVFLTVDGVGSFVRCLLPVRLTGGFSVTFGVWVGVAHDEMLRAFEVWFSPSYVDLAMDGLLANRVPPWNVLGQTVRVEVRNPDETPYCVSSAAPALSALLEGTWDHDSVLSSLPG